MREGHSRGAEQAGRSWVLAAPMVDEPFSHLRQLLIGASYPEPRELRRWEIKHKEDTEVRIDNVIRV